MTCTYTYELLTIKQFRKLKEAVATITFTEKFIIDELDSNCFSCIIDFSEPVLLPNPEELNA